MHAEQNTIYKYMKLSQDIKACMRDANAYATHASKRMYATKINSCECN